MRWEIRKGGSVYCRSNIPNCGYTPEAIRMWIMGKINWAEMPEHCLKAWALHKQKNGNASKKGLDAQIELVRRNGLQYTGKHYCNRHSGTGSDEYHGTFTKRFK